MVWANSTHTFRASLDRIITYLPMNLSGQSTLLSRSDHHGDRTNTYLP